MRSDEHRRGRGIEGPRAQGAGCHAHAWHGHVRRRSALALSGLLVVLCAGCATPSQAQSLPARSDVAAPPDAVIELWEQHWTLQPDGTQVYHEKRHVRLNDERAYGEFADPRITYNAKTDKLEVLQARTRLPDGTYRELPAYGHVLVGADASTGWPAFADVQQHLLAMSGVEPGCVLEVEYRITSTPGSKRALAADLRLEHHYPVRKRVVRVTVPADVTVDAVLANVPEAGATHAAGPRAWEFSDLPASPPDPQTPPWQVRSPRLIFSTAGRASRWHAGRLAQIEAAADTSDLIAKLAEEWTKDIKDPTEKMRALQKKLAERFSFVDFPVDWRPPTPRRASEVIQCNYGLPEEAAAALLALARAAALPVMAGIVVNDDVWQHQAPQDGMVAAYVVLHVVGARGDVRLIEEAGLGPLAVYDTAEYPELWDPHHGLLCRDRRWNSLTLLPVPDVLMPRTLLEPWTDPDESRCAVRGKVTLKDDGTLTGEFRVRAGGLFVSPEGLLTSDAQKGRLSTLVKRVLPDVSVESFSVRKLAGNEFDAVVQVKSGKPLKKLDAAWRLQLGEDGPGQGDVPLPLGRSRRELPVRLAGAFDEEIDLTVEWPEKWTVEAQPLALAAAAGDIGLIEQAVSIDGHTLRVQRHLRLAQRDVPAESFMTLRGPLNELRSEYARTLLLAPAKP